MDLDDMFKNHEEKFLLGNNENTVESKIEQNVSRDHIDYQKNQINSFCESIYSVPSEELIIEDGIDTSQLIKDLHENNLKLHKETKAAYNKILTYGQYNSKLTESINEYKEMLNHSEKILPFLAGGSFSLGIIFGFLISLSFNK